MQPIDNKVIEIRDRYKADFQNFQTKSRNVSNPNDTLRNYIKSQEDATGKAGYKDGKYYPYNVKRKDGTTEPFQTIGFGHKIMPGEDFSKGISAQQREDQLDKDISTRGSKIARDRYGTGFDNLSAARKWSLSDYAYTGTGPKGGGESKLSKAIRAGEDDTKIITEYTAHQGTDYRKEGQTKLFNDLRNIENPPVIKEMLDKMDEYHNSGESAFVLQTLYPEMETEKQVAVWQAELKRLRSRFESKSFSKNDLAHMEKVIGWQLSDSVGGLP